MQMKNNNRILNAIVNEIGEHERMEKRIAEAITALNVQVDIEKDRAARRERQLKWILGMPGGSID